MLALLLAAQIVALPAAGVATNKPLIDRNGLNLIPSACRAGITTAAGPSALLRPQDRAELKFRRLGDLPKAHLEIAVERSVGGCPAPIIVRYDVEGDGHAASGGSGR